MATTDRFHPFVCETSSTTGTGTFTLSGAVTGFRTFLSPFGGSAIAIYTARSTDGTKWEVGYGTVSGATLTRTLLASSTGSLIDFTGATPFKVYIGDFAWVLNSLLRLHFASSKPGWLPSMSVWLKDLGSSQAQLTLYDGTDDIALVTVDYSGNTISIGDTLTQTQLIIQRNSDLGFGPALYGYHNSASPAGTDAIFSVVARGKDSAGNVTDYGSFSWTLEDPVHPNEDAYLQLFCTTAGSAFAELTIGGNPGGIAVGAATSGRMGPSTVNASIYYSGGQQISDANGHLRLRTYTVGTLPSATAQYMIYVSNGTANKRMAVADGSNWRFPDGNVVT